MDNTQWPPTRGTVNADNLDITSKKLNPGETGNRIDLLSGNDTLLGSPDPDQAFGGDGNDLIYGYRGDDALIGENGDDTLRGGLGNDLLVGGSGNDFIFGEAGTDTMYGGAGNDLYVHYANDGVDVVNDNKTATAAVGGGGGTDTLYMGFNLADIRTYHATGSNDLLIGTAADFADGDLSDGVKIEGFFSSSANKIEYLQSADGYVVSLANVT